ncbi:MAG: hypothetical protein IKJ39_06885 [Lachnospiraceae bacterium]|nr:hypothetical protein [Lachnospiraceae bacterium]
MAFCTKCGKELAENEVCTCQQEAPVEAPQAEAPQAPVQEIPVAQEAPAKKPLDKKIVYGAAGVVALLLIVLIVSLAGGKPYKKMLDEYVSLVNKKSTDVSAYQYALMADGRVKSTKELEKLTKKIYDEDDDALEDAKEAKADQYEDLNDEYDKWKLSYEIKSAKKMDDKDLKDYQKEAKSYYKDWIKPEIKFIENMLDDDDELEDYADELDVKEKDLKKILKTTLKQAQEFEDMEITAGYEVKVKFFVKTKDDEYKTDMVKVIVLKANGDWVYAGRAEGESRLAFEESDLTALISKLNESYLFD